MSLRPSQVGFIADSSGYAKLGVARDLPALYASSRLAVNPSVLGTGLNIKSLEPHAFGCPVVTTPSGIRGFEDAEGRGILLRKTRKELLDHLERLFRDHTFYEQQRPLGRSYAHEVLKRNRENLEALVGCGAE